MSKILKTQQEVYKSLGDGNMVSFKEENTEYFFKDGKLMCRIPYDDGDGFSDFEVRSTFDFMNISGCELTEKPSPQEFKDLEQMS